MKQFWRLLNKRFVVLSLREKWLITGGGLLVIALAALTMMIDPTLESSRGLSKQLGAVTKNVEGLHNEIEVIQAKLASDPNQNIDVEFKRLLMESQQLSEQLAKVVETLISPSQMAQLLEQVLLETRGLRLVGLESIGAESITGNGENQTGYYLHPVKIELTGPYFAILAYLDTLESLPVNYFWRSFSYTVESYPKARLILEVYTLGTRQEFIGG
ncbi:MSHA biogenesis protein MshJ [Vibrio ostreicida]|uniref:MSHA biogenesis protein MshJ n=1 Tax=Vibrio ostreicida TaxID=526588 RepID=UPI000970D455|nr:MSHA biogenesis protein MshJ [Vibrio ostreicida]